MRLYRITPERYLESYSGRGGSYQDGARWNSAGYPVIYMALSASTALLEMANYVSSPKRIPPTYRLGVYELPESAHVEELQVEKLPLNWAEFPYPRSTQEIGDQWLESSTSVALIVPSVAAPLQLEKIVVLNPLHPDIHFLKLINSTNQLYSDRAFKRR